LVDAVGELVRRGLDVELRIAGEGSLERALRAAAAERGLAERVRFLGHVEDTPGFLRGLDAFALTSDSEGNPNALLEAMSCGLPTVATAVGGIEEVLEGGRAGLLVPPATRAPLVNALVRLVESKRLRATLGERARARVIGTYGMDRMLDAYEALYRAPQRRRG
jgi:glycosyltransferase involved in cell wall biosynthesis